LTDGVAAAGFTALVCDAGAVCLPVVGGADAVLLALMALTEPEWAKVGIALAGTTAENPPMMGRLVVT
jgi:hypothetical protein